MATQIDNETHWREPDIRRLVKAALDAVEADPTRERKVKVIYNTRRRKKKRGVKSKAPAVTSVSKVDYEVTIQKRVTKITIKLPKNGPKEIHSNPMVAIAASAGAPGPGTLLSPGETFRLAHGLAAELAEEPDALMIDVEREINMFGSIRISVSRKKDRKRVREFDMNVGSDIPPAWADATKLLICKVKDPSQDGTYLAFVAKKETALKRAETAIERETAAVESAERRLKKAKERKKEIEKALRSAAERRA